MTQEGKRGYCHWGYEARDVENNKMQKTATIPENDMAPNARSIEDQKPCSRCVSCLCCRVLIWVTVVLLPWRVAFWGRQKVELVVLLWCVTWTPHLCVSHPL